MKKHLLVLGATAAAAAAVYGTSRHEGHAPTASPPSSRAFAGDDTAPSGGQVVSNPFDDGKAVPTPTPGGNMPSVDESSPSAMPATTSAPAGENRSHIPQAVPQTASVESCDDGKRVCGDMTSCADATFHLNQCGMSRLDGDHDGVPCESLCRH